MGGLSTKQVLLTIGTFVILFIALALWIYFTGRPNIIAPIIGAVMFMCAGVIELTVNRDNL